MKRTLLLIVLGSSCAWGQNPGMLASQLATQQAIQTSQMASQQATQAALAANRQATQDAQLAHQQAMQMASLASVNFSKPSGQLKRGSKVRIKCHLRSATIYYTTNGEPPTTASLVYKDPIVIDAPTQLQAVAVAPNKTSSKVIRASYTVQAAATPAS